MSVTIKDVAKAAGVSTSTVSRTLHDHYSISEATKEKVRQVIQELGYIQANTVVEVREIGIVFSRTTADIYEDPFQLEILRGITIVANQSNYKVNLIIGNSYKELQLAIRNSKADGFIFLYADIEDNIIQYLRENGILYLTLGKPINNPNIKLSVDTDNVSAGYEAVSYLLSLGHTRIGYLGKEKITQFSIDRKLGYSQCLSEHNIPIRDDYILAFSSSYSYNPEPVLELLKKEDRPTAFVVCDDIYATMLSRIIEEAGLSVPEDISLVSFNNSIFSRLNHPELTTYDTNPQQLGMEAATQIIKHIEMPSFFPTRTIVPFNLVKRKSCRQI